MKSASSARLAAALSVWQVMLIVSSTNASLAAASSSGAVHDEPLEGSGCNGYRA